MENITVENAPLFLVIEVTKKTMKLVYVDTEVMLAEKIFREQGIRVKILNLADTKDPRYLFVGCRISGRDIDQFRRCMEELERRLLLTGYRDYREASLTELVRLIEGTGYQPEETTEEHQEYPKSMLIPFIPRGSEEDILMAYYALIRTDTVDPEVTVVDRDLERDACALILRTGNLSSIPYSIFRKTYHTHKNGITAVAALSTEGQDQISILLMPENVYAAQNLSLDPVVTVYDMRTEAKLSEFFQDWDRRYQEVRRNVAGEENKNGGEK